MTERTLAVVPEIEVGTHAFRQRYLFAFASQGEVRHHIRTQVQSADDTLIDEILEQWRRRQQRVQQLQVAEAGLPDRIKTTRLPAEANEYIEAAERDELFQKTFASTARSFAMVEIDKVVAPQRVVNLDYVDELSARLPAEMNIGDLCEMCISPTRHLSPIQHLEIAPNVHVFSSPNSDLRFLGAFVKPLSSDDLDVAELGGLPAAALIAFVGYGGAPVNVLQVGNRIVLNNGFHRVYALRQRGIDRIPVVIQHVVNPQLEFPPEVAGLPREYLLGVPRPVLIKDFFEPDFAIDLQAKDRVKMVMVAPQVNQHDVPS